LSHDVGSQISLRARPAGFCRWLLWVAYRFRLTAILEHTRPRPHPVGPPCQTGQILMVVRDFLRLILEPVDRGPNGLVQRALAIRLLLFRVATIWQKVPLSRASMSRGEKGAIMRSFALATISCLVSSGWCVADVEKTKGPEPTETPRTMSSETFAPHNGCCSRSFDNRTCAQKLWDWATYRPLERTGSCCYCLPRPNPYGNPPLYMYFPCTGGPGFSREPSVEGYQGDCNKCGSACHGSSMFSIFH
jgi:hypothetical protein